MKATLDDFVDTYRNLFRIRQVRRISRRGSACSRFRGQKFCRHQQRNNKVLKWDCFPHSGDIYLLIFGPCGFGNPNFGHPSGCPSRSRNRYSCSIPNHGTVWSILSITSLHLARWLVSRKDELGRPDSVQKSWEICITCWLLMRIENFAEHQLMISSKERIWIDSSWLKNIYNSRMLTDRSYRKVRCGALFFGVKVCRKSQANLSATRHFLACAICTYVVPKISWICTKSTRHDSAALSLTHLQDHIRIFSLHSLISGGTVKTPPGVVWNL